MLGMDIPLVEILFALGIIVIIILIEVIIILVLINYHLKNSRRLEHELAKHVHALHILHFAHKQKKK